MPAALDLASLPLPCASPVSLFGFGGSNPRGVVIPVPSAMPEWMRLRAADGGGPELAFRESFGEALCAKLGLPTAPQAGGDARVYQILPRSWIGRIADRASFAGMLLVDAWAGQSSGRKAIYHAAPDGRLLASFVDFSGMFQFSAGIGDFNLRKAMHATPEVYPKSEMRDCLGIWGEKIARIDRADLASLADGMPPSLRNSSAAEGVISGLLRRQKPFAVWLKSREASFLEGFGRAD